MSKYRTRQCSLPPSPSQRRMKAVRNVPDRNCSHKFTQPWRCAAAPPVFSFCLCWIYDFLLDRFVFLVFCPCLRCLCIFPRRPRVCMGCFDDHFFQFFPCVGVCWLSPPLLIDEISSRSVRPLGIILFQYYYWHDARLSPRHLFTVSLFRLNPNPLWLNFSFPGILHFISYLQFRLPWNRFSSHPLN